MNTRRLTSPRLLLRALLLETGAEFLKSWRMPSFSLPSLIFPVAFYAVFGIVLGDRLGGEGAAAYYLATFGVFAAIGPSLFGFGSGIAVERDQGWLDLKRLAPVPVALFLLARLAMALLFTLIILALLYALAAGAGGVTLAPAGWLRLAAVHLLTTLPFALFGLALGLHVRGQAAAGVANLFFMGFSLLGGLWIPIGVFPEILRDFALVLPSYHLGALALMAVGIAEGGVGNVLGHVAAVLAFTLLAALLAARGWRRAFVP